MINFEVVPDGSLDLSAATAEANLNNRMHYWGNELHRSVVRHASGRPGPETNTGYYVSTIQVDYRSDAAGYIAEVYSDAPFAHRLEYGFSGTDSSGRYGFSAPYPHFRPALEEIEPAFVEDISLAVNV